MDTIKDESNKKDDKTLGELLQRYSEEISKNKKSCVSERKRIRTLQKFDIASLASNNEVHIKTKNYFSYLLGLSNAMRLGEQQVYQRGYRVHRG